MNDRERWALAVGLALGTALGTLGWWLHFLLVRAIAP